MGFRYVQHVAPVNDFVYSFSCAAKLGIAIAESFPKMKVVIHFLNQWSTALTEVKARIAAIAFARHTSRSQSGESAW